ncbi:MAG: invasion associated locus B family protein [Hyphomicrobiaceae bacterium]
MRLGPAAALLLVLSAGSALSAEPAELLTTSKDWAAYRHQEPERKVCFAASQPKDSTPKGSKRSDVYFYLSFYPGDGVRNEVMVRLGFSAKAGSPVTAVIDNQSFELVAVADKAYLARPEESDKFVEALKKGNRMVIKATPDKGAETTDVYSLLGVSNAAKQAEDACAS